MLYRRDGGFKNKMFQTGCTRRLSSATLQKSTKGMALLGAELICEHPKQVSNKSFHSKSQPLGNNSLRFKIVHFK